MFPSTTAENFRSWDRFLDAYYGPIRTALSLIPFVGEGRADDLAQSFFLKMFEKDILKKRPSITGRFRNWLYIAARRHAVDEWRNIQRRPEHPDSFELREPVDLRFAGSEDTPFEADEFYALSILHMAVGRVRSHLIGEGKSDLWMIFEELVLAPLIPGRVPKTREEILAMFPGQGPAFLDNRLTTVKRVFRRIVPALIPADPTENLTAVERFEELLEILHASKKNRLWLAFLTNPIPGPEESAGSSLDLAARSSAEEMPREVVSQDSLDDELRVLLGFWLEMPVHEYLDDLEGVGPAVAAAIGDSRPCVSPGRRRDAAAPLNLNRLIAGNEPVVPRIPPEELILLFQRLKLFVKQVHRALKREKTVDGSPAVTRRESSMPVEVAQVLYCLAGALALTRCGARIIGISDDRYRKNISWVLDQSWLDSRLRPVFLAALEQLGLPRSS